MRDGVVRDEMRKAFARFDEVARRNELALKAAHIRGAYNVPLDVLGEHGREIRSTVSAPVVLVCQSGQRARKAEEALRSAGMPNLHVLDGGVNGWVATGSPVVRGAARRPTCPG